MIMLLMSLTLATSVAMILLDHPVSMGMTLLFQSVIVAFTMGFMNYNFWYSYILFLIMVGGLLVLFNYMINMASNEMFEQPTEVIVLCLAITFFGMIIFTFTDMLIYNMINYDMENYHDEYYFFLSLNKFFSFPSYMIITMLMIYLLITLIAVVKISNLNMGPLRKMR